MSTIAAIATPPGEGGVAIIRVSGADAIAIVGRIFSGPIQRYASHTAHFGSIIDDGETIDEVLLLVMRTPRSYTGEDTVEIQCHGGSLITRRVLESVLKAGAKPASPGEFTYRAFMNGKIDLAQAEAVQQLIGAKNELALLAAKEQLSGSLSDKILTFKTELTDLAAIIEAWVDFPEEGLEFASFQEVISALENTIGKIETLESTFHEGKILHQGLKLCLAGAPNVGKSSLMNALLGTDRAIVTDIPGTTRDILEEELRLGGLHFRLIDTAGIRTTSEVIEAEGIRRSRRAMEDSDLILLVLDASRPLSTEEQVLLQEAPPHKTLIAWNKIDLPHTIPSLAFPHQAQLSAKEKFGLSDLKMSLEKLIWKKGAPAKDEIIITLQRHKEALKEARLHLQTVIEGLKNNISAEFVSSDMRAALKALSSIIGSDISEDILSAIFAKFCVGK